MLVFFAVNIILFNSTSMLLKLFRNVGDKIQIKMTSEYELSKSARLDCAV